MNGRHFSPWRVGLAMFCVASLAVTVAAAQVTDAQSCLRVDYSQPALPVFSHATPAPYSAREVACWINVQEAHGGGWMPLDVRDAALSARAPLTGVAALPLESVADRQYLREQPLVLVGTGVDLRALTKSCLTLRQHGFARLRVLVGGARSWSRTQQTDMLTPQEVWLGGLDGQWRIATVGLSPDQWASLPVPPEITLPASIERNALQRALADAERLRPSEPNRQWLVVVPDGTEQQALIVGWQQSPQDGGTRPVAWLSGGWVAYRAYLSQQQHSAANAGRALPHVCGS